MYFSFIIAEFLKKGKPKFEAPGIRIPKIFFRLGYFPSPADIPHRKAFQKTS